MAENWPVAFNNIINSQDFAFSIGETVIRSEMSTGPKKTRKRFTKAIDAMNVSMTIPKSDYATFRTFYDTTLNNGQKTFNYTHPLTNTTTEFRFSAVPAIRLLGNVHLVISMQWEIV